MFYFLTRLIYTFTLRQCQSVSEKLREEMLHIALEDKSLIEELIKSIDTFKNMDMPVFELIYTLGLMSNEDAGYLIGGSYKFAKSLERKYIGFGGRVNYNSKVEKIIVENNTANGDKRVLAYRIKAMKYLKVFHGFNNTCYIYFIN